MVYENNQLISILNTALNYKELNVQLIQITNVTAIVEVTTLTDVIQV